MEMVARYLFLLVVAVPVGSGGCSAGTRQQPTQDAQPGDADSPRDADSRRDAPDDDALDGGDADRDVPSSDELEVALEASRVSGVAPLAVFFDASATTTPNAERPFHDVQYEWRFGDETSGTWATTGLSKNLASGPLAAHVFETPGHYVVTVNATDPAAEVENRQVEIVVGDPEVEFAGARTVCVSNRGDFAGAPAGARQVTASTLAEVTGLIATGTRVLLRRGETWSATESSFIQINVAGPGILGAFGEGDPPRLEAGDTAAILLSGRTPLARDFRIMDIAISGNATTSAGVGFDGTADQILLQRLEVRDVQFGILGPDSILDYWNANGSPGHTFHDQLAIVETRVEHTVGGGYNVYLGAERLMLLGNVFDDSTAAEHVVRTPLLSRAVVSHNHISRAAPDKHVFKLHGPEYETPGIGYHRFTELVLVSHNLFTGGVHAWTVVIGPQNSSSDERLRDLVVERNFFLSGPSTQVALVVRAQDVTVRNNLFDLTEGPATSCARVDRGGIEPPPARVHFLSNTCFSGDATDATLVWIEEASASTTLINNLVAGPASASEPLVRDPGAGTGLVERSNLATRTPGFVVAAPTRADGFALAAGSPAIDVGEIVPGLLVDFAGTTRPVDGNGSGSAEVDVGAFEYVP
jgi:hypothetical protein